MNYRSYRYSVSILLNVLFLSYGFSQGTQKSVFTFKENDQGVQFLENSKPVFFYQKQTKILAGQLPDHKMVDKYGLVIPPPNDKLDPAPEWLQIADMFTSGGNLWKEHKFILKDTLMTRIVRMRDGNRLCEITENYPIETIESFDGSRVNGVSLIPHVPHSKKAFEEAHKQGMKVIPYIHFTDIHSIYADQDVFLFQHPEILLKDAGGKWVHISMDGSDRAFRFLTCINSPSYWKLSMEYVKKMMDWGADGIFVDNVENRESCFAQKFNVAESSSARNPEFPPYIHEHLFPDPTQDYAWDRFLQAIRTMVKSYGEDKNVELPLPAGFKPKQLQNLYDGSRIIQVNQKKVRVAVSGKTARVYLLP